MKNRLLIAFIVVYILYTLVDILVHGAILSSSYQSEEMMSLWRPDMESNMWIVYIAGLVYCFFFTFIFSKGYQNKGAMEGVRYGLYVGLMVSTPMAYISYALYPIPYGVAFQWFLYGIIQNIICGVGAAFVYGKQSADATS